MNGSVPRADLILENGETVLVPGKDARLPGPAQILANNA